MESRSRVVVVGAGPGGARAAAGLAELGLRVLLLEEKGGAWEKPCGGGLTERSLHAYPFLREAGEPHWLNECELISPAGRRTLLSLKPSLAIYSRQKLNEVLLTRALAAGAEFQTGRAVSLERVGTQWQIGLAAGAPLLSDYVVIAAGARQPFRQQLSVPLGPSEAMSSVGYYVPETRARVQIRFLPGLTGYIWTFPRRDHTSAGICGMASEYPARELRRLLERFLEAEGWAYRGAAVYGHLLPMPTVSWLARARPAAEGWAAVGDAAGLVDPITGEGLHYALRSADLLVAAVAENGVAGTAAAEAYQTGLRRELLPELERAAALAPRFYHGSLYGIASLEGMVALARRSRRVRNLLQALFAGEQGYLDLKARLLGQAWPIAAEFLTGLAL